MDYNGRNYQMVCEDGYYYIGSTKNELRKRFHEHKKQSKTQVDRKVYKHINSLGWDKVKMVLIEEYTCKNKQELIKKEYEFIQAQRHDKMCLNICGTTDVAEYRKQYYRTNKETIKEDNSKYYETNKERILQRNKEYRMKNADKLKEKDKGMVSSQ